MSSKITVIGAGSVGSTIAYTLSNQNVASEIVLIDINKEKVEGEVMDFYVFVYIPLFFFAFFALFRQFANNRQASKKCNQVWKHH